MKKWIKIILVVIIGVGLMPVQTYRKTVDLPELDKKYEYCEYAAILWDYWEIKGDRWALDIPSCCAEWWKIGRYLYHITISYSIHNDDNLRIGIYSFTTGRYFTWSSNDGWDCRYCEDK